MESLDQKSFKGALSRFATGVAVVTTSGDRGPVGMTVSAFSSLSLNPPLLLVCLDNDARTLRSIRTTERFGVNLLAESQHWLSELFASKAPEHEKFLGVGHRLENGVPVLEETVATIICDLGELISGGDHTIATGRVRQVSYRDDSPLVYYRGSYRKLSEIV